MTYALAVLVVVLASLCLIYQRQFRAIARQLQSIKQDEPTNRVLSQEVTSKDVTLLVTTLNQLLTDNRAHARDYQRQEKKMQEGLTHLAHDLRTPLATMEGYLQLLQTSDNPTDQSRYLKIMTDRLQHTRHLMDQYFTSLKYDNHKLELPRQPIVADEVFLQSLFTFAPQFDQVQITPEIKLACPVFILAQTEAFERLCQNLIQNSLSHGQSFFQVASFCQADRYHLVIRNGRDSHDQLDHNRLFDRFYKGDQARTKDSTGLGLSIARGLTQLFGGQIVIEFDDHQFQVELSFPISSESECSRPAAD